MFHTYVGSQPIYNSNLEIYAYKLLFRNSMDNKANFEDADRATSELIINSLTDIGLDRLIGKHKASIKFTRNFLLGEYPIPKLKNRIIIELEDTIEFDDDILKTLGEFSEKGFTLSMSEETYLKYFSDKPDYKYIVKFNIKNPGQANLLELISSIKDDNVKTMAEMVETQQDFISCNEIGFDYFGGFFFCEPLIVKGVGIPGNKLQLVKLLHKLQDEETSAQELDSLISTDITLSYRLLRYANSSYSGLKTRVESIQHAVSLLGLDTIKMIATLMALSSIDDKPQELFFFGLIRAKMCEHLTEFLPGITPNMAFTVGLLSIINALLDSPMEDILAKLPLNENLTMALLNHEGPLGHMLHDVIAYINNKQDDYRLTKLSDGILCYAYLQAVVWANSIAPLLNEKPAKRKATG
ncbi:MAG: HDOD domain-containing protein [Gammaproteobacteria bacterium]|nr:HDOD domain-containing protein [Gammaproteobacteria bacterium]